MEKELIIEALNESNYDIDKACRLIGMTKTNFTKKMQQYKIKEV
jgi:transcriptional regulator with GAF, ATPase, and Fis domain